ncbi:TonB-dependent receptor [Agriterribacter sp.]|uniref:TonB-dependent receptor n=1 Tax=Agriterribacter sp. TaxID=2821509 RepID=UPI002C8D5454|nr:TonB-dependent receptor [Agriterribacter sp.]HRP57886.1 TonB-dependent receptor [Agriterribacter sp.]
MKKIIYLIFLVISQPVIAQQREPLTKSDTIPLMTEVVIKGFESERRLLETPVSAGIVGRRDMQRFSNASLVPAINIVPGVRMEERSPGSYRLSIRGSLLRSPFGVRNVKVYWNDIPFTDAGGNTYFNLADQNSIRQIEILKGPAGSIYGANTGGVVILHPDELPLQENIVQKHHFRAQVNGGSYGSFGENVQWQYQDKNLSSSLTQSHLQSDGYRQNTRLRRDVLQWNGAAQLSEKDKLDWILMYADMYYQTPGGLTLQQMQADPRQARPATPAAPGAAEQKAAIYNKTPFAGLSNRYSFNEHWSNVTSVMLAYTDFKNPFITNYEARKESNAGLRTKMVYHTVTGKHDLKFIAGMEWLYNYSAINNYGNRLGNADTIQFKDKIWARQILPFLQGEWWAGKKFQLQAGLGTNFFVYHYQRLTDPDDSKKKKKLNEQLLPRLAALYRVTDNISLYASVSKGFSPPAIAEVRPSEGSFYSDLQPEYGWNREIGIRGKVWKNRLLFDITAYRFKLQDAIVRRINNTGAEYFVNAGGTDQKGMEAFAEYILAQNNTAFIHTAKLWASITLNDFTFTDYFIDDKDYSGNALTGVAKTIWSGGFDMSTAPGMYLNTSFTQTSKLPLNDANGFYAPSYQVLLARLGWKKEFNAFSIELFTGTDNALNQLYSLGNDINAFGNRYYNPAPARNYYGGLIVNL